MRALLLILLSSLCVIIYGQDRTLTLKHKSTGTVYEVDPEKAVKCKLSDGQVKRGYIHSMTEETIVVNGDSINLDQIQKLSSWHTRKNASAKTGGIVLTSLGGLLTVGGVVLTAGAVQEDDEGTVVGGVTLGAATTVVGLGTTYFGIRALKRKRFDMTDWNFIVENY